MSSTADWDIFLAHYGVKGMRWGVRKKDRPAGAPNRQERRLEKRQSRREGRAQKFDAKAAEYERQLSELHREQPSNAFMKLLNKREVREITKARNTAIRDAEAKRQGKLSTRERKIAIGAAVVGVVVVSAVTYKTIQSGEANRLAMKGRAFIAGQKDLTWRRDPKLSVKTDSPEILNYIASKANPGYGAPGTKVNCRRSTFAYEMRRRGYDVSATRTTTGYGQNRQGLANALTPGSGRSTSPLSAVRRQFVEEVRRDTGKSTSTPYTDMWNAMGSLGKTKIPHASTSAKHAADIFDALSSQPNGARGELGMLWRAGGGHSMAWEIVKGSPVILDTQTGRMYKSADEFMKTASAIASSEFTRLDNVDLNTDFLMRWVRDARS